MERIENVAAYRGTARLWRVIRDNVPIEILDRQDTINRLAERINQMRRQATPETPLCEPVIYEMQSRIIRLKQEIQQIESRRAVL